MKWKPCVYCGKNVTNGGNVCQACREKLPLVRRIIAIGVELKLQAAKEKQKEVNNESLSVTG